MTIWALEKLVSSFGFGEVAGYAGPDEGAGGVGQALGKGFVLQRVFVERLDLAQGLGKSAGGGSLEKQRGKEAGKGFKCQPSACKPHIT